MLVTDRVGETNPGYQAPEAVAYPEPIAAAQPAQRHRALGGVLWQDWPAALLFLALDVVCWLALYSLAGLVRQDAFYSAPMQYFTIELLQLGIVVQALFIIGGYNRHTNMRSLTYTTEHLLALMGAMLVSLVLVYSAATFDQSMRPSRSVLLISFILFGPLSLGYRRMVRRFVAASVANRAFLVVGSDERAADFYRAFRASTNRERLEFVDIERNRVGEHIAGPGTPVIEGDIATKLANLNDRYSGVILAERVDHIQPELLERLVRTQFHSARVYTLEGFYEAHWRCVPVSSIDPFWPLQMGFQLARMSPYHYLKRLFDIVFSIVALTVCAPLIGLITLLVSWQMGRPALFRQQRVGREGELFTIYKFRTMTNQSPDEEGDIYTRAGDTRVTTLGRWLRKLRLDELPQLWNVLRGDMSLIGPRAEWIRCAERYEKKIPFYHFRHLVKPGITGWAQVNYPYGESDEDAIEKLKYDLYYIRRYSLKLDAMIVLKTVHTMLFARGR
jgi:exopolysaccharide biosynthesis polyprenyl glycosylphosphotransferase